MRIAIRAALVQAIAHGEAGLAPANDDGLDALHHGSLSLAVNLLTSDFVALTQV